LILGIDPGASGAVAVLDGQALVAVHDMPTKKVKVSGKMKTRIDSRALYEALHDYQVTHVFLEQVSAMPGQGVSSMFAFGRATGIAEGVAATQSKELIEVRPQVWKKHFGLDGRKDGSRDAAMERWPRMASYFQRKKDDGRAEAALIGLWGHECLQKLHQV
jgi:crossover junction endodeoxyribonuclease RuvC